ncbi:MAG: hypothetical protein ACFE9I_15215 [Candidatus Hermodarchaeota archaeon]
MEEKIIQSLIKFFDLEIDETFFEIVLITKKKKIINFNFEIPSEWARGNKEFVMLSLIMKREYESELVYAFIVDASYKILKTKNVYKAFYKFDDFRDDSDIEIDLTYEQIKKILFNCLTSLIIRIKDKINGINKKDPFPFS